MSEPEKPKKTIKPKTPSLSQLAAKRAENLRKNLQKRKEQARGWADQPKSDSLPNAD